MKGFFIFIIHKTFAASNDVKNRGKWRVRIEIVGVKMQSEKIGVKKQLKFKTGTRTQLPFGQHKL